MRKPLSKCVVNSVTPAHVLKSIPFAFRDISRHHAKYEKLALIGVSGVEKQVEGGSERPTQTKDPDEEVATADAS